MDIFFDMHEIFHYNGFFVDINMTGYKPTYLFFEQGVRSLKFENI